MTDVVGTIPLGEGGAASFLRKGELVSGKVAAADSDSGVMINIKGRRFFVDLPFPVQRGEELTFEVRSLHPRLIFAVIPADVESVLTMSAEARPWRSAEIAAFLDEAVLFLAGASKSSPAHFGRILSGIFGLFYRGNGADALKVLMTLYGGKTKGNDGERMLETLFGSDTGEEEHGAVRGVVVEGFTKAMELFRNSRAEGAWYIPYLFEDEMGTALLRYGREEGEEGGNNPVHDISFLLELSALGGVEALARLSGNELLVLFRVESRECLAAIEDGIPWLRDSFERMGFDVKGVDAFQIKREGRRHGVRCGDAGDVDLHA